MRKITLTILGALLIGGWTVQTAPAEPHHLHKARMAPVPPSQQFRNASDSFLNQGHLITDCQYREPGNPYDERTDYMGWSTWRQSASWDSRNDCW
jgi:hypothetical protein